MSWALLLALAAYGDDRIIFTKSFPASTPPFTYVAVERSGNLVYREDPNDSKPLQAQLGAAQARELFAMTERLGFFKLQLESGLKVANTGKKTFRFEPADGAPSEVVFNYSENREAQQLLERFEQIAATERAYIDLERTMHFDKLGVNEALAQIEALWLRKELAAPAQFMPLLDRISKQQSIMHLARDRAARLKDQFGAGAKATTTGSPAPASLP